MRIEEAEPHFRSLLGEYREVDQQYFTIMRRREVLKKMLDGYIELFPELKQLTRSNSDESPPSATVDRPRGQEAVRRVLVESADHWWTIGEMVAELKRRDWLPDSDNPASAVRTAMERLAGSDQGVRKGVSKSDGYIAFRYSNLGIEEGA